MRTAGELPKRMACPSGRQRCSRYDIPTIAKKLYVSENTVRTHAKKIYATLEVHSKQEIIELSNASYDA